MIRDVSWWFVIWFVVRGGDVHKKVTIRSRYGVVHKKVTIVTFMNDKSHLDLDLNLKRSQL